MLRDDQWERLKEFVPGGRKGKRGPRTDNRRFLNALLWMARSGGRWRDLPERLGDYETPKATLLPLDRDGRSGRDPRCARSRSGMADDRFHHRAGASAGGRRSPAKRGRMAKALIAPRGPEHQNPRRRRCAWQSGAPDRLARPTQRYRLRARADRRLRP